jgi:hypothetical protein
MMAPDVTQLVESVRREIDERRARGQFTPEQIDPKLGDRLQHESHDWNIDTGYWIRTTRTGLGGAAVRWAKHAVRPFVRLYTDHILNRQAQVNLVVWHFLLDSVRRTLLLELEVKKLQHQIDELKQPR